MKKHFSKLFCMLVALSLLTFGMSAPVLADATTPKAQAPKAAKETKTAKATKAKKTTKAKPSAAVKKAQAQLSAAGFKVDADGLMGPKTRNAIKSFQKKNGLKVNGKLNKATLAKLGV